MGGKGKDIFAAENKIWLEKAEKKANELIGQVKSSCDMVIVGKAIWEAMAIPKALYGRAVIPTNEVSIKKLQRIENRVWRYLLGIGGYSTVEGLRGEIGASSVRSRIMESMLAYIINTNKSKFENLKNMMKDAITRKKGKWYRMVNKYREELNLTWKELVEMDRSTLKKCIRKYDNDLWEQGLRDKKVLHFYALEKRTIGYEYCYKNNFNSKIYAKARINALQMEEHKGRGKTYYDSTCKLCQEEIEDIVHFKTKCTILEIKRNYNIINKDIKVPEERMRALLFRNKNHQAVSKMLRDLWELRKKNIKTKINNKLPCPKKCQPRKSRY